MSEIDAAELARLREKLEEQGMLCYTPAVALIDALEKARRGRDQYLKAWSERLSERNAAIAERDSARALLREIHGWLNNSDADRARIAKETGQ